MEYPPDSLLVIPTEPKLKKGDVTNQDVLEWSLDMRAAYRQAVENINAIRQLKETLSE